LPGTGTVRLDDRAEADARLIATRAVAGTTDRADEPAGIPAPPPKRSPAATRCPANDRIVAILTGRLNAIGRRRIEGVRINHGETTMKVFLHGVGALALMLAACAAGATEVMVLGTYHMANPGADIHNLKADDVLVDKRQRELADVAARLAKFRPTKVAVEAPVVDGAPAKLARYHEYLDGKLGDSRNEVVQVGFRLARQAKLAEVWGIDVDGDFPFEAVQDFAGKGHPELAKKLQDAGAEIESMLEQLGDVLAAGSVADGLRFMNEPKRISDGNAFYSNLLRYGAGKEQPGAVLLSAWEARNNQICARLVQLAETDDRLVVLYGSGHAFLLRRCVQDMPGFKLVEANPYLR
jgi:hypothetical protein